MGFIMIAAGSIGAKLLKAFASKGFVKESSSAYSIL
jgi:hypothetical protein